MAYTPKRFIGPLALGSAINTPTYTFVDPAIIKNIALSNTTNGQIRCEIYLASTGTDAQTANKIYPEILIEERSTVLLDMSLVINAGDKIYIKAQIPNAVLATVSGVSIS